MQFDRRNLQIAIAFVLGLTLNLISVVIGNPYVVSLFIALVAAVAAIAYANKPLPWIVLVSVVAANPVNLTASISLNLVFAVLFLILNMQALNRLPRFLVVVNAIALLSALGSLVNLNVPMTPENLFSQGASYANYVLGPFLFVPLIYCRLQDEGRPDYLLNGFVYGLIVPTVLALGLARTMGYPISGVTMPQFDYMVNISLYRLLSTDFLLTRTQVGIVIAALICASFAVVICNVSHATRVTAAICLSVSVFLLLVTGSAGSSLAALCGLVAILFVGRRFLSVRRLVLVLLAGVAVAYAAWFALPEGIRKYAESRYVQRFSGGQIDVHDRIYLWKNAVAYLFENPTGVGWSLFIEPIGIYSHNDYLAYAIGFGLLSGVLYLAVPGWMLIRLSSFKPHSVAPAYLATVIAGVGTVTVLLANSFSDHLTTNRWYFNVVWSVIWYVYFVHRAGSRHWLVQGD